jgi:hypothetical protein
MTAGASTKETAAAALNGATATEAANPNNIDHTAQEKWAEAPSQTTIGAAEIGAGRTEQGRPVTSSRTMD